MNIVTRSSFVLSHRHLLGIEGLSRADILGLLDLSGEFVELNRQIEKKTASLRGRTLINLFFEASTRTPFALWLLQHCDALDISLTNN